MLKNWKKKMIAILLIFTMTFSNFALVGKAYAATIISGIFGGNEDTGDTGSKNVEFDAYFKTNQDSKTAKSAVSDIKSSDLLIGATVKVKNSGYLKDAKILFGNGKELNFVINSEVEVQTEESKEQATNVNVNASEEVTIGGETEPFIPDVEDDVEDVVGGGIIAEDEYPEQEENHSIVEEDPIQPEESFPIQEEFPEEENPEDSFIVEESNSEIKTETKDLVEENKQVQSFEDNTLYLVQLNADSEMNIEFPISYNYRRFVEKSMISKTNKIKFVGTYINDNAEEIKVSKTVDLKLSWEDEREVRTSAEITKYLGFSQNDINGIILQTSVFVDNLTDNISLPIKDSEVKISVPEIDGIKPETINIVAKSLSGTTGKENDEVLFQNDNWSYDSENNEITIKVQNKSELVSTQNENDILVDETAPVKEMYYSESGIDNYLITYTYKDVEIGERQIVTKVNAKLNEFGETTLLSENEMIFDLVDEVGSIVTFTNESSTDSVSKGYTYLNYNNEENKYEIEIDNKLIFNVSYKDIVEGLYYSDNGNQYVSKSGQIFEQEDLYYKTLELNKENFDYMLGEEGIVNIYSDGNLIYTINKDTESNEDGVIKITFENTVKNIQIDTSKPVNDGNLIFSTIRAYSDVSYNKDFYKDFDKLTINTIGRAKYIYLEDLVDIGNSNLDIKLEDTKTEASLEIGQESLSTLAINNNVEMKIELNNEDVSSDVYGNSRFQIKLPEYVENVEVTDYNMVYGEGLELDKVQGFVDNGSAYIDINVTGKQKELSSGIITNGTNIVLNTNIKVDLFAPASEASFELTYVNDDATNYTDESLNGGFTTTEVSYSAPSGVVSVNSISGYSEDENRTITSVNQGKVQDEIAIYSESKIIKSELTIMNNEKNDISDLVILGRLPFEGVKDITTGDDLGTTIDTKMISRIIPEDLNEVEFKYYYSENGEATQDLTDLDNGWTDTLDSLDNVKSFLIVPADSNYKMEPASKLRFTYEYEIPENLEHNTEIFGTFATYYTNNTDIATLKDVSKADLVGLITGEGPQFDCETKVNKDRLNEYEELEITTTVKNTGKMQAHDVVVTIPIPKYTQYVSSSCDKPVTSSNENAQVEFQLSSLDVDDTATFKVTVLVEQFYDGEETETEMIEIEEENDENSEESEGSKAVIAYALITATDLDTTLQTKEQVIILEHAEMRVFIENTVMDGIMFKGNDAKLYIRVQNLTDEQLHNVVATFQIANGFEFVDASVLGFSDDGYHLIDLSKGEYNESTRTVTWKIGDIDSKDIISLRLNMEVGDIDESVTKATLYMSANAQADGTSEYSSGNVKFVVGRPKLVITQTTSTTNSYVKEGETINYQFIVKNEGSVTAQSVRLIDHIPEGLVVKRISYTSEGMVINKNVSEKDEVTIGVSIPAGDSLVVDVGATAVSLNGVGERSVTNNATVAAINIDEEKSNDITHIIESSENVVSGKGEASTGQASSSSTGTTSLSKTYKITGTAWLDKNNDGMRSDGEQLMKGIKATLVDSDGGVIKQTTVTNSKGEYSFTGVRNGNYIIIFDYDTILYTVTVYQKENVANNVNSDVITTKIEENGKIRNGAVTGTVTVADGSISNIDIGLIEALKFDLSLNMGISKITTNTSKGTETKTYDNSKLTKTEIAAKQIEGSSVYIEYTLTVKNEGEVAGLAKKIADYVPEGMEFNSGMNQSWYTGSDGILYTTSLANTEIQPGETKTFKLVLSKNMTGDNLGTVSNTAEIVEDYNIYGVSDLDSTPGNRAQNEDDFARVDSYLSVKTGEIFIYIPLIITTIVLFVSLAAVIVLKVRYKLLTKGGV